MTYFKVEDNMDNKTYRAVLTDALIDTVINTSIDSSYNIIFARLFNLNYVDFLRMVRDVYKAELRNKNGKYINFVFKDTFDCDKFVKDCNKRFAKWMEVRMK